MPWLTVPIAMMIGTGVAAGTTIAAQRASSKANKKALAAEEEASVRADKIDADNEGRRRHEWDKVMAQEEARWNAEQARLEPYRSASRASLAELVRLSGLDPGVVAAHDRPRPKFDKPMPDDWEPGDPTGVEPAPTMPRAAVRQPTDLPDDSVRPDRPGATRDVYNYSSPLETGDVSEEAYAPLAASEAISPDERMALRGLVPRGDALPALTRPRRRIR